MKLVNINSQEIFTEMPKSIKVGGRMYTNPSIETLNGLGWYEYEDRPVVPAKKRVLSREWTVSEGKATETVVTADKDITSALWDIAHAFRTVLRAHFGVEAETNTNITELSVMRYFALKRINNDIDASDGMDAVVLMMGFNAIKQWTGDGTSWSFPWDQMDAYLATTTTTTTATVGPMQVRKKRKTK